MDICKLFFEPSYPSAVTRRTDQDDLSPDKLVTYSQALAVGHWVTAPWKRGTPLPDAQEGSVPRVRTGQHILVYQLIRPY